MGRPSGAVKLKIVALDFLERDVRLRMPFRFGVVTLTESPQAFVRARIRTADGREGEGAAAELLAPKWFDKNPALSNEDNYEQLRVSLRTARERYLSHDARTAWRHASPAKGLVENYGPALIDRAVLDALARALGISFYEAVQRNAIGAEPFEGIDLPVFFARLKPLARIAARHTVGLVDPITAADVKERVGDGLPETLEEVIARYGHRWFKLKVGGNVAADLERLAAIASVLDRIAEPYRVSLDGNEQYEDIAGVAELWRRMKEDRRLERLVASIAFLEQPVKRSAALERRIEGIEKPVIIDESDDSLEAFPRARALGYRGVSSKTCKGLDKSMINAARGAAWHEEKGPDPFFLTGEDLTIHAAQRAALIIDL